jgi:hypothetical protein
MDKKPPLKPIKDVKKPKKKAKGSSATLKISLKDGTVKVLALFALTFGVQFLPIPLSSIKLLTHSTELYSIGFLVLELWHGFNNRA